jgi:hypothetical protein
MYGFHNELMNYTLNGSSGPVLQTSNPYAFFFTGMPFENASWQYQTFNNFMPSEKPSLGSFAIPDSCATAIVCPGWS